MTDLAKQFLLKLKRFSPDDISLILENTSVQFFKKGEIVLHEGVVSNTCFLVIQGSLRQFRLIDGVEKTSSFFFEEDPIISYPGYLKNEPSEYCVQCLEDILISGTKEQEMIMRQTNPLLEYLAHHIMVNDFKKAENYISLLNNFSPEERYQLAFKNNPKLFRRVSLVYIASYLGVTPESLSRIRKRILNNPDN